MATETDNLRGYLDDVGSSAPFNKFVRPVIIERYGDLIETLLSDQAQILHGTPGLVRQQFKLKLDEAFDKICENNYKQHRELLKTIHHGRRIVWKVIRQIRENSDRKLNELVTDEYVRQINDKYGLCSFSEIERRLLEISRDKGSIVGEILFEPSVDRPSAYPHLLPIGRALFWSLPTDITDAWRVKELEKLISESYCLPRPESSKFRFWKYAYELCCEAKENELIWERKDILKKLKLIPDAHLINGMKPIPDAYSIIKEDLLEEGVNEKRLEEIERRFEGFQKSDLYNKKLIITHNALFFVAMMLDSEEQLLYNELLNRSKTLLHDVAVPMHDSEMMWQKLDELRSALKTDLLLYSVFYDYIYLGRQMIKSSHSATNRPRPGIPKKWMERATDSLIVELINTIKAANISKPFEDGAKVLNALSDSDLYPRRADETSPSKSVGAEVLRKKYERMLNLVTPVTY